MKKTLAVGMAVVGFATCAETLIWTGSDDASNGNKWFSYSTKNWKNESGAQVQWADGNDARFDDASTHRDVVIGSNVGPKTTTFDVNTDMTLTSSGGSITYQNTLLAKYGLGTVWFKNSANVSQNRVEVWGGTLRASSPNSTRSLGNGDSGNSYDIVVHDGGKVWVDERNALGPSAVTSVNGVHVTVYTNGIFSLHNGIQNNQNIQNIATLDLLGGTLELPDGYQGEDWTNPWLDGKGNRIGNHSSGFLRVWDRVTFGLNPSKTPYVLDMIGEGAVPMAQNRWQVGTNTEFRVEDITGDDAADVTFNNPLIAIKTWDDAVPCGFRKTGAGKMVLNHAPIQDTEVERPTGAIRVEEGTLEYASPLSFASFVEAPIYVGTNATLIVTNKFLVDADTTDKNAFGVLKAGNVPRPVIVDHGTLTLAGTASAHVFGDLTLDGAALDFSGVTGHANGFALGFYGKVSLLGTGTLVWDDATLFPGVSSTGCRYAMLGMTTDEGVNTTVFDVPDRTGDDEVDFRLLAKLRDQRDRVITTWYKSGFQKTGAGLMTIEVSGHQFTGDVEVREGTLAAGPLTTYSANGATFLGYFREEGRKVVASGTGTIWVPCRNSMLADYAVQPITNAPTNAKYPYTDFRADGGGAIKITEHQHFHKLTFSNGGKLVGYGGNGGHGIFTLFNKFTVSGNVASAAEAFSDGGDDPVVTAKNSDVTAILLNGEPEVEFEIADTTGDAAPDATFYRALAIGYVYKSAVTANPPTCGEHKFGFRKTGAGTMRLATIQKPYGPTQTSTGSNVWPLNGTLTVAAGELKVDCDQGDSELVDVAAGAYLSGTGTVNNVVLAAGAGLKVPAQQEKPLTVKGEFTLGANPVVDINLPAGATVEDVKAKILTVEGIITGAENLKNATVRVNGEPTDNIRLAFSGNTLKCGFAKGFMLMVR